MLALHLKLKMRHEPSYIKKRYFSCGPVVKTLCFHCTVRSLVKKLSSHMPCGRTRKNLFTVIQVNLLCDIEIKDCRPGDWLMHSRGDAYCSLFIDVIV